MVRGALPDGLLFALLAVDTVLTPYWAELGVLR